MAQCSPDQECLAGGLILPAGERRPEGATALAKRMPQGKAPPRRRTKVAAGSVGIAGAQTGVYPLDTPGGWRIIGRTPLRLYDQTKPKPFLLEPGNFVRFVRIDRQEFERFSQEESKK